MASKFKIVIEYSRSVENEQNMTGIELLDLDEILSITTTARPGVYLVKTKYRSYDMYVNEEILNEIKLRWKSNYFNFIEVLEEDLFK